FILHPRDCVRDRLSSYVYFASAECLDQAALVAISENVDLNELQKWSKNEGPKMVESLKELKQRVKSMQSQSTKK
ncbi:MAG: hypothetical protein FWC15_09030, partial [Fibromonadales bacterium]|nr:hypothetical protein [Fibromonadales bacterium]